MAIKNSLEDDQQQQQGGINTTGAQGTTQGVAGTSLPAGDTSQAPTSSGFVNLDKYLAANQGSGAKLASDATADLSKQVGSYGNSAKATAQQAQTDYSNAARSSDAQAISQGLAKDASGTKNQAANFLGANYGGQQAGNYTAGLQAKQGSLDDNLRQVDDANYQQGLLSSAYGKAQPYTPGFGALDTFLINGSDDGRQAIANVKGKTADVDQAYGNASNAINDGYNQGRNQFAANQASVKGTAHNLFSQRDQGFANQVAQKNAALNYNNRTGVKAFGAGDVTSDKDRLDLQALAALSGDNYDANKYAQRGGSYGAEIPADTTAQQAGVDNGGRTLGQISGITPVTNAAAQAGQTAAKPAATPGSQGTGGGTNVGSAVANYVAPRLNVRKAKF